MNILSRSWPAIVGTVLLSLASQASAVDQPPEARAPATRLAQFGTGAFLESIVVRRDGTLLIADHHSHEIIRVTPAGTRSVLGRADAEITGLGLDLDDTLYITGRRAGGPETVFRVDRDGRAEPWVEVRDARFLNGMALLRPGVFLAADSFGGAIWRIDVRTKAVDRWLGHELLQPNPQNARIPGANGVKLFDGAVYVSNSGRASVLRIPLNPDGAAGAPAIWAEGVVIDDFAFAENGDLYGTTHIFNSVVVLRRDGSRATIATAADGVTGSTAVAFGGTEADAGRLYVVGDGGAFLPPPTGIVPANLVTLQVSARGLHRDAALSWAARPPTVEPVGTYMVQCRTAANTEHLRASVGPGYLRYLELNNDRIAFAGQVFDDPKASPTGRVYFVRTGDERDARSYIEASPYYQAGMYAGCEVKPFQAILGALIGGVGWPEAATRVRR